MPGEYGEGFMTWGYLNGRQPQRNIQLQGSAETIRLYEEAIHNYMATEIKKTQTKKVQPKEVDEAQKVLDMGAKEIASFNGERRFELNRTIYTAEGYILYSSESLENSVNSFTESGYNTDFRNPNFDFIWSDDTNSYRVNMRPKKDLFTQPKSKNISFQVVLDPAGEVLQGKKELEENNLLGLRKLNRKEEIVVNIRELIDLYVMEEINRTMVKFDPKLDKSKYEELYKKHYKRINSCKSEN